MIHIRLTPDRRLDNKDVEDLLRLLAGMYRAPYQRWNGRGFTVPDRAAWEVVLGRKAAAFQLTVPEAMQRVVEKQLAVVWPRATAAVVADPLAAFAPVALARLELKQHYMFGLRVDRRSLGALPSLLEVTRMLGEQEQVAVQVLLDPAAPAWWEGAVTAYEAFKAGRMPKRRRLDRKGLANAALRVVAGVALEAVYLVEELVAGGQAQRVDLDGPSKAMGLREQPVGQSVAAKLRREAFDTTIRVAVSSPDPQAAEAIMRAAVTAFRSLDGDNALVPVREPVERWRLAVERAPGHKWNSDYLGAHEAAMLVALPTGGVQEEYGLAAIAHTETNLPALITQGGLRLGVSTYKGATVPVFLPTANHDELCLPHIVIGGMGTGKTQGFGANLVVEAVRAGFSAVIIDPAKGEAGNEIATALEPSQIVRYSFDGQRLYAIDWREVQHAAASQSRGRLAAQLCSFVETAAEEAGAQTTRFLRAAAKVVPTGRLSEVVDLLTDRQKAMAIISQIQRPDDLTMWQTFWDDKATTPARRTQIGQPILNRLDVVTGDTYLEACMDAPDGIDLVALLEQPGRAVILDIPADLGPEAQDVLGSWLATKLQLAMYLRQARHPVFVVQDEPHQYMRSSRYWQRVAVESRKYRFCFAWLFHAWEQIPRDLAAIIQAAGPHYHLYTSSKHTFRALAEEIHPFTVEEAMRIPMHWALHAIRAGGEVLPPFLAKMSPPPSLQGPQRPPPVPVVPSPTPASPAPASGLVARLDSGINRAPVRKA